MRKTQLFSEPGRVLVALVVALAGAVLAMVTPAEIARGGTVKPKPPRSGKTLAQVNYYRVMGGLPKVSEDTDRSTGARLHAKYMVKENVITHFEDPSSKHFTDAGSTAAAQSNIWADQDRKISEKKSVEIFMSAPFHAIGILRRTLESVGIGVFKEKNKWPAYQVGFALDVLPTGSEASAPSGVLPWPGPGTTVPLTRHRLGENPDPLTSCKGYSRPTGLPLILQLGETPDVTDFSFRRGTKKLKACSFDETNYKNPNSGSQTLGRNILRDTVVLIPKDPLEYDKRYKVSITSGGVKHKWSFSTSKDKFAPRPFIYSLKPNPLDPDKGIAITIAFQIDEKAKYRWQIRSKATGSSVAAGRGKCKESSICFFSWDGRIGGTPAPAGKYVVKVTATDSAGNKGKDKANFRVK